MKIVPPKLSNHSHKSNVQCQLCDDVVQAMTTTSNHDKNCTCVDCLWLREMKVVNDEKVETD